ncbi:MAG: hypothetical protein LBE01_04380 [Deltaproteobacteria bacterium]|jgi:hypothetical protein|nr:hypothetical protein [Deltaproteobacteria bacterium]
MAKVELPVRGKVLSCSHQVLAARTRLFRRNPPLGALYAVKSDVPIEVLQTFIWTL